MNVISQLGWNISTLSLLCLSILVATAAGQLERSDQTAPDSTTVQRTPQESDSASFWMAQKLRLSQQVLAGLANGDFDQIGKSAEVMQGLNKVEAFVRREPQSYRDYLRQFMLANDDLVDSAAEENLAGATLAFNQLTISCVNCHRHLRETN